MALDKQALRIQGDIEEMMHLHNLRDTDEGLPDNFRTFLRVLTRWAAGGIHFSATAMPATPATTTTATPATTTTATPATNTKKATAPVEALAPVTHAPLHGVSDKGKEPMAIANNDDDDLPGPSTHAGKKRKSRAKQSAQTSQDIDDDELPPAIMHHNKKARANELQDLLCE